MRHSTSTANSSHVIQIKFDFRKTFILKRSDVKSFCECNGWVHCGRTVSHVISGVFPVYLVARERQAICWRRFEADRKVIATEARDRRFADWLGCEPSGRSTAKLISNVQLCTESAETRDTTLLNFCRIVGISTVIFTRWQNGESSLYACVGVCDTAEHTSFACDGWDSDRRTLGLGAGKGPGTVWHILFHFSCFFFSFSIETPTT